MTPAAPTRPAREKPHDPGSATKTMRRAARLTDDPDLERIADEIDTARGTLSLTPSPPARRRDR